MQIKLLAVGDVVGVRAVDFVSKNLRRLKSECGASIVVLNGENAAPGNGLDPTSADALFAAGADVITSGNHIWHRREIKNYIDDTPALIRPANYPTACPGEGYTIVEVDGVRFLVVNLLGTIYMDPPLACPFGTLEKILDHLKGKYDIGIVDFHAEATSEKIALARYFDARVGVGRVSAIFGTHTHVQTADETVLPGGTAFITDLGMTGPVDSVLGIRTSCILDKLRYKMPVKFEVADGKIELCGAVFTFDTDSGRAVAVERVRF